MLTNTRDYSWLLNHFCSQSASASLSVVLHTIHYRTSVLSFSFMIECVKVAGNPTSWISCIMLSSDHSNTAFFKFLTRLACYWYVITFPPPCNAFFGDCVEELMRLGIHVDVKFSTKKVLKITLNRYTVSNAAMKAYVSSLMIDLTTSLLFLCSNRVNGSRYSFPTDIRCTQSVRKDRR